MILSTRLYCEPHSSDSHSLPHAVQNAFEDTSRWTVQHRLDTLVQDGEVKKKKHGENRVSYWIPK